MRAEYIGCIGTHAHGHQVMSLLCKVTSSCKIASQHIQELLEAYFKIKKNNGEQGRTKKSVPQDHCLSSLNKPGDAKR